MAVCEVCGNDSRNAFELAQHGEQHTFDSFECAIEALAPVCGHCGCRVIGHGIETARSIYCCPHCASQRGEPWLAGLQSSSAPPSPFRH